MSENDGFQDTRISRVFGWIAAGIGFGFTIMSLYGVLTVARTGYFDRLVLEHFASALGLPFAAIGSLVLVVVLRTVAGPIEIKFLGFEFRGASGPIIMWILCFLAITYSIAKTWDLKTTSLPQSQSSSQVP